MQIDVGNVGATFAEARADFERAWRVFLSKRTEADFQAWRDQRDWTARKHALWDAGKLWIGQTVQSFYEVPLRRGVRHAWPQASGLARAPHHSDRNGTRSMKIQR
jgi:hypothetical protein